MPVQILGNGCTAAPALATPSRPGSRLVLTLSSTRLPALIICLGALARLLWLTTPLTNWHSFRQSDTAAIARNFHEGPMNLLYPRVDWGGDTPGFAETEFQIYTYAVACLYHLFGTYDWLGRLVNILLYVPSAWLLFRLVKRLGDVTAATFAVFFYAISPLSFIFTRNFQPDTLMCLGAIASIYYFWDWTESRVRSSLLLASLGLSLAVLIKPLSLCLGLPLFYLCYRSFGWRLFLKHGVWFVFVSAFAPPALWYAHAQQLYRTYGNTFAAVVGHQGALGWFTIPTVATFAAQGNWPFLSRLAVTLTDRPLAPLSDFLASKHDGNAGRDDSPCRHRIVPRHPAGV
jgi:4-amino-4-deoxy-L-arabinose transferase-like glycosyltransferase